MAKIIDTIKREDFLRMYLEGKSFGEIAEAIGVRKIYTRQFFVENFCTKERLELNKMRAKNINREVIK